MRKNQNEMVQISTKLQVYNIYVKKHLKRDFKGEMSSNEKKGSNILTKFSSKVKGKK